MRTLLLSLFVATVLCLPLATHASSIPTGATTSMFSSTPTGDAADGPAVIAPVLQTDDCDYVTGQLKAKCIPIFIGHVVVQIFRLLSVLFILNMLYAGYQIAIGAWSGEKAAGKDRLLWSIIGLIISVLSFVILDLVLSVIAPDA